MPRFIECGTNREIPFAPMTDTGIAEFTQSYNEISSNGKLSIVADVDAELLDNGLPTGPMRRGACEGTPRTAEDPLALTRLLTELREQLDHYRSAYDLDMPMDNQPDLVALVGVKKEELLAALGEPSYCNEYRNYQYDCRNSDEWMYSFKSEGPIRFGGCCGLELDFNAASEVTFVKWQGYR